MLFTYVQPVKSGRYYIVVEAQDKHEADTIVEDIIRSIEDKIRHKPPLSSTHPEGLLFLSELNRTQKPLSPREMSELCDKGYLITFSPKTSQHHIPGIGAVDA